MTIAEKIANARSVEDAVVRLVEQGGPMMASAVVSWLFHHREIPVRGAIWEALRSGKIVLLNDRNLVSKEHPLANQQAPAQEPAPLKKPSDRQARKGKAAKAGAEGGEGESGATPIF